MTSQLADPQPAPFLHEALVYAGDPEYVVSALAFIEEGFDLGEPVLVAVPQGRLEVLGPHVERWTGAGLQLAAMEDIGRNPAWIIPAWRDFVAPHLANGRSVRGIGEPIWAARSAEELVECQRHEALLNLAFADADGFTLLCPYDAETLADDVLEAAEHSHPRISARDGGGPSHRYAHEIPPYLSSPLSPPPAHARTLEFDADSLGEVRHLAAATAEAAGVAGPRLDDLLIAVGEAASNSVRHGGGGGRITLWHDDRRFLADVADRGRITDPLAGRVRPAVGDLGGRGVWLMHQLCDLVQVRATPDGQVVRLHLAR